MDFEAQDHTEIEWQFSVPDPEAVLRWLAANGIEGYRVAAAGEKHLEDTYFDTEDWRIHRAGFTARVRRTAKGDELTMKVMAAAEGGLRSRREMTEPIAPGTTPLNAPGPCGDTLRVLAGKRPLRAQFTLQQVRRAFVLSDAEGELAEIAVDETTLPGEEGSAAQLSRVEVELTDSGSLERVQPFVDALVAAGQLAPAEVAKFQAGLAAARLRPPGPWDFGSAEVRANMNAAQVAFAAMRRDFAAMLTNEPGTRLGEDIEALHDMRVAARRLRAALQTFREFLPEELQRFRAEIGWVAQALGEVRDLDVQLETLDEWQHTPVPGGPEALEPLGQLFRTRRKAARELMLVVLDSERYERLVQEFSAVLRAGAPAGFAPGRKRVLEVAPELIEGRHKKLRKRADAIKADSPPERYHAARIEAKKLRYAVDFVEPIYGKRAAAFAKRLGGLQDVLGKHQDAEVAQQALRDLAEKHGGELPPATLMAMGAISERYRVSAQALRGEFADVYAKLHGKPWRKLDRRMASLQRQGAPVVRRATVVASGGRRWRVRRPDERA